MALVSTLDVTDMSPSISLVRGVSLSESISKATDALQDRYLISPFSSKISGDLNNTFEPPIPISHYFSTVKA